MLTGMAQLSVLIFALLPAYTAAMDGQFDTTVLLQARKAKLNEVECPGDPPCSEHGECEDDGECACNPPWGGDDCSESESQCDRTKCSDHGVCYLDECFCFHGFVGEDCSLGCPYESRQGPENGSECSGHGECVASEDGTHAICHCDEGFYGGNCQNKIGCPGDGTCGPHGFCTPDFKCECYEPWFGIVCEQCSDIDGCS